MGTLKLLAGYTVKVLKVLFKPAIAIISGIITFSFVAGRFYERAYMIANENWVKRGATA